MGKPKRKLSLAEAEKLARRTIRALGFDASESRIIADHIVDSAARGGAGLPRILVLAEHIRTHGVVHSKPAIRRRTAIAVALDGKSGLGYLSAYDAVRRMINTAWRRGVAMTTVSNIYYAGHLAYYVEMATRRGLIAIVAANTRAAVAPYGGSEALLGTNPIAFGFPTADDPIILDIKTSATSLGEVSLAAQLNHLLPEGIALDFNGRPTRDPKAAMEGVFKSWGGHRGSGLGVVAQLFGVLAGSEPVIDDVQGWGFFALAFRPDLLMPAATFKKRASALARRIRASRRADNQSAPRMPFEGSIRARKVAHKRGIEIDEKVYRALLALCDAPALRHSDS